MSTSPSPGGVIASKDRLSFSCQWADVGKGLLKENQKKKKAGQSGKLFERSLVGFQAQKGNCATFLRYIRHEYDIFPILFQTVFGDSKKLLHQLLTPDRKCKVQVSHSFCATYQDVDLIQNTEIELLVLTFDTHMGLYQQRRRLPSHIPQLREEIIGIFASRTGLAFQHIDCSKVGSGNQPTNQPLKKVHCSEGLFSVAGLLKGSGWVVFE